MTVALYRRHRSSRFSDLIGQPHVAITLLNELRSGRLAHAYLFAGIRGTGKTSTARILARAVNCLAPDHGEPCNTCDACREINGGAAVDVLEIDAASNRGIDDIRELRDKVNYLPATLRRKVYIIDEAHMLTTDAWNAFLKTLEEPPSHVLFILATTEPHKVPETVRSRTQRFDFRRVSAAELTAHLGEIAKAEDVEVEPQALALLARSSQGSVRDALSLLDQVLSAAERPVTLAAARRALGLSDPATLRHILAGLAGGDGAEALRGVAAAFDSGTDAQQLVRELGRLARCTALLEVGYVDTGVATPDEEIYCRELQAISPTGLWTEALEAFSAVETALRQAIDPRLLVELTLLKLIRSPALVNRDGTAEGALLTSGETGLVAAPPADPVVPSARSNTRGSERPTDVVAAHDHLGRPDGLPTPPMVSDRPPAKGPHQEPLPDSVRAAHVSSPTASPSGNSEPIAPTPHENPEPAQANPGLPSDREAWSELWPALVEAVVPKDPTLAGILRDCRPLGGGPDRLRIGAPYTFHFEKMKEPGKSSLLHEVVRLLVGADIALELEFCGEARQPRAPSANPELTRAVLEVFPGSRVVSTRLKDVGHQRGQGDPPPSSSSRDG